MIDNSLRALARDVGILLMARSISAQQDFLTLLRPPSYLEILEYGAM